MQSNEVRSPRRVSIDFLRTRPFQMPHSASAATAASAPRGVDVFPHHLQGFGGSTSSSQQVERERPLQHHHDPVEHEDQPEPEHLDDRLGNSIEGVAEVGDPELDLLVQPVVVERERVSLRFAAERSGRAAPSSLRLFEGTRCGGRRPCGVYPGLFAVSETCLRPRPVRLSPAPSRGSRPGPRASAPRCRRRRSPAGNSRDGGLLERRLRLRGGRRVERVEQPVGGSIWTGATRPS